MSINLVVMPAGPALVRELAPRDSAGQAMVETLRLIIDSTGDRPVHLVGSRSPRWQTATEGSFRAWGAPQVDVGEGSFLPELVQRYVLGERAARVREVRAALGAPDQDALTLVAADGSAGLTQKAPLSLLPGAAAADLWCRQLLAGQKVKVMPNEGGILEPELWRELAALMPTRAELIAADMEYGVGRYVAAWQI